MLILIVGLGSIARKHINAINSILPNVNVYALRRLGTDTINDNITNIYELSSLPEKPHFAIISNPTSEHYDTIVKLISLDCPLFIEKPVLSNIDKAEKLQSLLNEKRILTYVACNLRFHPVINFLKHSNLQKQIINEVNVYCGSYLPNWRPGVDYKKIYSSIKELGGGVDLDLIHEIDYIYWLFGKPLEVKSLKKSNSSLNISSNDFATYTLVYEQFCVNIILNYYRVDTKRVIEILFDNDTWTCDLINCRIDSFIKNEIFSDIDYSILNTYTEQISHFNSCIINRSNSLNSFADGIATLKIALNDN